MKRIVSCILTVFLFFVVTSASLLITGYSKICIAADGLYTVTTADGIVLKMKRYRPTPDAPFREGAQPVLLFPGILCNMNEFLTHTPEERRDAYSSMKLTPPVADWAQDDPYIQKDPMRYYSIGHYLWIKGYDPWFANYRGTGRGEFKSSRRGDTGEDNLTTLDIWATQDAPACIDKVVEVTHKHPVIGGHSTGGLVSYVYLQGAYIDPDELDDGYERGYISHVKSDPLLAELRNSQIKGFIGIDPAGIPPLPEYINAPGFWLLMGFPVYLDFDRILEEIINPNLEGAGVMIVTVDMVFGMIHELARLDAIYGEYTQLFDLFPYLDCWYTQNMDPYVEDFIARYLLSSTYLRALSEYYNIGMYQSIREHWKNGAENKDIIVAGSPDPNDGYYYYDEHMYLMSVPSITVLSQSDSLVEAEEIIRDLMEAKQPHEYDEWHLIPNTAHVDIPMGLNAPVITFPLIGEWLDKVCAEHAGAEAEEDPDGTDTSTDSSAIFYKDSDEGLCFINTSRID
ncbi:MAG: hypothetical protein J7L53_00190 [Deltaproteobacteria bacterium]|nr:hypothetical protein [Deltaproteobacteria bacterium]